MLRSACLVVLLAVCASAAIESINDIPAEYRELIPEEAREFLTSLTDADKVVIKDIAKNFASYKNEEEALNALKAKSPSLGAKAEKLHQMVKQKVEALSPEAKAFAKEIIAGARKLEAQIVAGKKPNLEELKAKANTAIAKYKDLSEDAKADLQNHFPILTKLMKNQAFQKLAEGFLGKSN
ncbi:unnamed protein product [Caenorhabditis auriculariae]|uniref:Fatty-acid and retinol-binding protein 1 n=1 Tax=Caenorhabditis auriculariae TaxID=2777116 RepID=A0A8S1H2H2_9PELO|nr:unnamed protein product [Caenorhabditis auriculariae]